MRQLDRSPFGRIEGMAWSFDSRWLAYGFADTAQTTAIKLGEIESGQTALATRPTLRDTRPAFDPEGKYLYFIGQRDFDPVYDELHFDLGFPKGSRPFAITLRKDLDNPFIPRPKPPESQEVDGAEKGRGRRGPAGAAAHRDRPGRHRRSRAGVPGRRGTLRPRRGHQGQGCCSRRIRSRARAVARAAKTTGQARGVLESYDLETQKQERLVDGISDFSIGRDGKALLLSSRRPAARAQGRRKSARQEGRQARPRERLDRPGAGEGLDSTRGRVAPDVPGGVAPAARAVLDRGSVGHRLGRGQSALRATGRSGHHALRVLGPVVGAAGRAGDLARLRDGRRVPHWPQLPTGLSGRRLGVRRGGAARTGSRTSRAATRGTPTRLRR